MPPPAAVRNCTTLPTAELLQPTALPAWAPVPGKFSYPVSHSAPAISCARTRRQHRLATWLNRASARTGRVRGVERADAYFFYHALHSLFYVCRACPGAFRPISLPPETKKRDRRQGMRSRLRRPCHVRVETFCFAADALASSSQHQGSKWGVFCALLRDVPQPWTPSMITTASVPLPGGKRRKVCCWLPW